LRRCYNFGCRMASVELITSNKRAWLLQNLPAWLKQGKLAAQGV
jgi:hypothetical protein